MNMPHDATFAVPLPKRPEAFHNLAATNASTSIRIVPAHHHGKTATPSRTRQPRTSGPAVRRGHAEGRTRNEASPTAGAAAAQVPGISHGPC